MLVGDRVRVKPEAWAEFLNTAPQEPGDRIVPLGRTVVAVHPDNGKVMLHFPMNWWDEEDLEPIPKTPPPAGNVTSLAEHRIRAEEEFEDEQVAYIEALWGKNTYAFNAAVRDLEGMRRGKDDGSLRPPMTYYEAEHMVLHVRALANDLARHFNMPDMVRAEDDLHDQDTSDEE